MKGILREAEEWFRRWRSKNEAEPAPTVAVYLNDRDRPIFFTGLAVAPDSGSGAFVVSGLGYALPIYVLREDAIARIVVGEPGQSTIGF